MLELLEREEQLDALGEHLASARTGAGRLLFLGGEAGAGKTQKLDGWVSSVGASKR